MIGSTIAHYRITSLLGEGGMGAVYRATDTKLNRDVAIKVLPDGFASDADRLARFGREAQVLASLNHPNIAAVYGIEERAIVMELVEGQTLADRIAQGAVPLDEALPIARQIAEALAVAHEKGIIHRDLKPANVKINPDGQVKVLDFGLAKLADAADGEDAASAPTVVRGNSPTLAGAIMGTAGYMAPEQARGQRVDKRADIWAFGVVLFEMLTGKDLFGGRETVIDRMAAVVTADPDWTLLPVGTPASIRRLLRRALERDRRKRLHDIVDARLEIDAEAEAVVEPERQREWLPWVVAAVMLVVAAGSLWALWRPVPESPTPKPMRFQIAAPPGVNIFRTFSISPDGTRLAFWGSRTDGVRGVWLRAMDTLDFRQLRGTENVVSAPDIWSPDSRFVAFDAGAKLVKVDVTGGLPQTICEVPGVVRGGSWNRDGVIVFASNTVIWRVPAAGGTPSAITALNATRKDRNHSAPVFLPDGRHFLYLANSATPESSGIYLASLDSPPERQNPKRLVPNAHPISFVTYREGAAGAILFQREGMLLSQPFDLRRLETTGEVIPVVERNERRAVNFAASDNGTVIFGGSREGRQDSQLEWFDRQGKRLSSVGVPHDYIFLLRISPDGTRVAATRDGDIWLTSLSGSEARFTFDPAMERNPVWSPDGRRIAFTSNRAGNNNIYQHESNGAGQEELLFQSDRVKYTNDWSPDGRFLLYYETDPKTQRDLWVLPMDTTPEQRKPVLFLRTEFNERYARFSPDSHWVAYESDESGPYEIYVRPFPASGGGGKYMVSQGGGTLPVWSGDNKELFYLAPDSSVMVVSLTRSGDGMQPGKPKALFKGPLNPPGWDVSRDGKRFLLPSVLNESEQEPFTVLVNWLPPQKK